MFSKAIVKYISISEGLFSVFVYDDFGFALSMLTGNNFSNNTDLQIILGPRNYGTDEQFFYDCPFSK